MSPRSGSGTRRRRGGALLAVIAVAAIAATVAAMSLLNASHYRLQEENLDRMTVGVARQRLVAVNFKEKNKIQNKVLTKIENYDKFIREARGIDRSISVAAVSGASIQSSLGLPLFVWKARDVTDRYLHGQILGEILAGYRIRGLGDGRPMGGLFTLVMNDLCGAIVPNLQAQKDLGIATTNMMPLFCVSPEERDIDEVGRKRWGGLLNMLSGIYRTGLPNIVW